MIDPAHAEIWKCFFYQHYHLTFEYSHEQLRDFVDVSPSIVKIFNLRADISIPTREWQKVEVCDQNFSKPTIRTSKPSSRIKLLRLRWNSFRWRKVAGSLFEVVRISFVFCFVLLSYMIPSFEMLQFSVARSYLHFPQITSLLPAYS